MTAIHRNDIFFASARSPSPIIGAQPTPRGRGGKINPHVTRLFLADGRVSDVFHVKPVYYETRDGFWRPLSEITAHHGNRSIVLKPEAMYKSSLRYLRWLMKRQSLIGGLLEFGYPDTFYWGVQPRDLYAALSLTAYPDADPETTTVDGYVQNSGTSWSSVRDAAVGATANSSGITLRISSAALQITRAFALFDTSTIGDSDTITAATLDLYVEADVINGDNDGNDYLALVSSAPATNTALITADYNDIGATLYANTPDIGGLTADAYNTLTLTATGRNAINKIGVSKFAVRMGHDYIDHPAVAENTVAPSSADNSGTSQDPKLTVTYTASNAGDGLGVMMF